MSERSVNPTETGSCFTNPSLSSETADVGSSMDTTMVSPPKLAEPSKSSIVSQSSDVTGGGTSKTQRYPTVSADKQGFSKRSPNLCRGKWLWIILIIIVIVVLIAVGVIVYVVTSKSTTVIIGAVGIATRRPATEMPTRLISTTGEPTRQISTGEVPTKLISTSKEPTKRVSTTISTSKPRSSTSASTHAAPTITQDRSSTYCTTPYYLNTRCDQTRITLRPATEAFFLLSPGVLNRGKTCSGSLEISADAPDRVVLWTPVIRFFRQECRCPRNQGGGCPETVIASFKINGKDSKSDECSKATSVSDNVTVRYRFTKDVHNNMEMFYRAIEAIKIEGPHDYCISHKPFVKQCTIGNVRYCIHPGVPCLDGCKFFDEGHIYCGRVDFLMIKRSHTLPVQFTSWVDEIYIFPGNKATLYMKGNRHSNGNLTVSFRSADSRIKLSVKSNRIHDDKGCSVECFTWKNEQELFSDQHCANAVFVQVADTVAGVRNASGKLLCDPVSSGNDRKLEMIGSGVKLSAFRRKYSKSDAEISIAPICGAQCYEKMRKVQDCFGNF